MKTRLSATFRQEPMTAKCVWLVLAAVTFLICFYGGTLVMSIIYPLDSAMLPF